MSAELYTRARLASAGRRTISPPPARRSPSDPTPGAAFQRPRQSRAGRQSAWPARPHDRASGGATAFAGAVAAVPPRLDRQRHARPAGAAAGRQRRAARLGAGMRSGRLRPDRAGGARSRQPDQHGQPDAVLLAIDHRGLPLRFAAGDRASGARRHRGARSSISTQCGEAIRATCRRALHRADARAAARKPVRQLRPHRARHAAPRHRAASIAPSPTAWPAPRTCCSTWRASPRRSASAPGIRRRCGTWRSCRSTNSCLPIYADHVARLIAALRGRSRKCLILDLDNTVWGGVIGDDGLEGIKIAQGDATGEAHLAVQQLALTLRQRGVVLAVSSKNTDEIARTPFREHPEMLLKEDHFAVFQANWNDKATNIKAIAEELSLGLDAMVFLDDNPGRARPGAPDAAAGGGARNCRTIPALYARTLAAAGYFESVAFSDEDRKRAEMYQDNARRVALQKQAGDLDAYLASLDMEITFAPFDRDRAGAHQPTDQQVQPVQPDHPPLHRGRGGRRRRRSGRVSPCRSG